MSIIFVMFLLSPYEDDLTMHFKNNLVLFLQQVANYLFALAEHLLDDSPVSSISAPWWATNAMPTFVTWLNGVSPTLSLVFFSVSFRDN